MNKAGTALNERQLTAVRHGEDPLLILAGAGTGKTATLVHRVAAQIESGVPPGRILLLTFTRRAAAEMDRRVKALVAAAGARSSGPAWSGTFHAVAARLLRLHGSALGLPASFTILDRADAEDLLNLLRSELDLAERGRRFPLKATCLDIYSRTVNAQERLEDVLAKRFPWCSDHREGLAELFRAYVRRKEAMHVLDYDDLLVFWQALLRHPAAGRAVRSRFDRVLVDEFQDTNLLQAEILGALSPDGRGLTVVGDDAQSIYSFRAATVRNILDFEQRFPGTQVVALEQVYRSHSELLAPANAVLDEAAECYPKKLWSNVPSGARAQLVTCTDEGEQAEHVARRVLELREEGVLLRDQAVLFRAAHHSLVLELELAHRDIPYRKYGGLKFLESAHVKDFLAFVRLAENPRDQPAGMRVLLLVPGIGPARARSLLEVAQRQGSLAPWQAHRPATAAQPVWDALIELFRRLTAPDRPGLTAELELIRDFYWPLLERTHDQAEARLADLDGLIALSSRFGDRASFLAELVLDPPSFTGDLAGPPSLDEDYLILSTIHSAKGLEWQAVYLIHCADGNLPADMACGSDEQIEEERRLFYVALTRARRHLEVLVPLCYYTKPRSPFDRYGYAQPSRFLTPAVRRCFEERVTGAGQTQPAGDEGGPDPPGMPALSSVEVRTALESLW